MIVGVADEPELVLEGLGFGIQCIRTTNKLKDGRERDIERGERKEGRGSILAVPESSSTIEWPLNRQMATLRKSRVQSIIITIFMLDW